MPNALQKIKYMPKICKICQSGNTFSKFKFSFFNEHKRLWEQYAGTPESPVCERVHRSGQRRIVVAEPCGGGVAERIRPIFVILVK